MGIFPCLLLFRRSHHVASTLSLLENRGFIDETRETRERGGVMDVMSRNGSDEFEFWPIEHPIEPSDEDRPVKCPMPNSSPVNDESMHEEQFSESLRKRAEHVPNKERRTADAVPNKERTADAEPQQPPPPVRAMRKRHHHTLTRSVDGSHRITPLVRTPPLYPSPPRNLTIFDMLQHFNKFES